MKLFFLSVSLLFTTLFSASAAVYTLNNHTTAGGTVTYSTDAAGYTYGLSKSSGAYEGFGVATITPYFWVITEDTTYSGGWYMYENGGSLPGFLSVGEIYNNSFSVDGHTIHAYRFSFSQCNHGCAGATGSYTNFGIAMGGSQRVYGLVATSSSANNIVDAASMYSALNYATSSGGGGGAATSSDPYITTVPATLFASNVVLNDVTSSSTYTYTSPDASTTLKQVGLIFITHLTSVTPSITWGGTAMTLEESASHFDSSTYTTSLYYIRHPSASSTISITSVASSSIKFLSTSVWSNADATVLFDKYYSKYFTNRAYVDLPNVTSSASTNVGVFFGDLSAKSKVGVTNVLSNSSSTYQFSLLSSSCINTYECPIGYLFNSSVSLYNTGVSLAINLYATSTISFDSSISTTTSVVSFLSSSTVSVSSDTFASVSGDTSFSSCFTGLFSSVTTTSFWSDLGSSFVCTNKVAVFWILGLFFPTPQQVYALDNYFISSLNNGKLTTSFFLFFYHLKALADQTATTTADFYAITVPTSISGGSFATTSFPISISSTYHVPTNVDTMFANWLSPFFAVFGFFIFAMYMLRLLV